MKLIDDWRKEIWRLWSIRVALIWTAIGTIAATLALISDEVKAALGWSSFASLFFVATFSFGVARLLKQPGTDEIP